MTTPTVADVVSGANVPVAERIYGNVVQAETRRPEDLIQYFDLDAVARGFVGRDDVFTGLAEFARDNPCGYFEIVAEAGLGKTALAAEIARRFDAVAFLASASSGVQRPDQFLAHAGASLILRHGLGNHLLSARIGEDNTHLVRIMSAAAERAGRPLWLVVDGLDEATPPPRGSNPLLLPDRLPTGVFVVVTRRVGTLNVEPGTPYQPCGLLRDDRQQTDDITTFVRTRAEHEKSLPVPLDEFVERVTDASEGNFMYVSYLLADLRGGDDDRPPMDMDRLPRGLPGYYEQFWQRMRDEQSQGWAEWQGLFRPVIEHLAVAFEPVTADWLAAQAGRDTDEVRERVLEPWSRVLSRSGSTWRLVHRSFADYLEGKLDLTAVHRAVADHYCGQRFDQVASWDEYGLRHAASHLAEVAERVAERDRHEPVSRLVRLVTDYEFQSVHLERLRDPTLLRRDLESAHRLAAKDPHTDATFLLVLVALTLVRFRRQMLQPEAMIDAAARGDLAMAERLLDLFVDDLDDDWQRAIRLSLAWLAAPVAADEATRLRDRVAEAGPGSPTLTRLFQRVDAALRGEPARDGYLPQAATPVEAEEILARLAGSRSSSSLQGNGSARSADLSEDGRYLASVDGPLLVALAQENPAAGEPALRQYLDLHIAYGYRQYRNRSLWFVLDAVTRHPDDDWVRRWLGRLSAAVLAAPDRGEFLEGLEIAILARMQLAGDENAAAELARRRTETLDAASAAVELDDLWATKKRRLAALAEAYTRLPGGVPDAAELVAAALAVRPRFAGFAAPAELTLAESVSIVAPSDGQSIGVALNAAEAAAHNVQDLTFCARSTSRVAAMRKHWWPPAELDLGGAIRELIDDPYAARFAAAHQVGESYRHRGTGLMPPHPTDLTDLAELYQRPLAGFLRANPGLDATEPLPSESLIAVPDPGMPPLLAARLSAAVIVASGPPSPELAAQMRHLVPLSQIDVTAHCTVLTRLLLCTPTDDLSLLAELLAIVRDTITAADK